MYHRLEFIKKKNKKHMDLVVLIAFHHEISVLVSAVAQ